MVHLISKFGLLAFTLLTFVSQLALANSQLMVTNSPPAATHQSIDTKPGCHHGDSTPSAPCCDHDHPANAVTNNQTGSCCDSENSCQGNCNHCVVIVFNAALLNADIWQHHQQTTQRLIAIASQFPSILLSQDFKPPIRSSIG
ncbi:hypothetical protein ACFOD0_09760 [Shewanella intestini]|uniref:CopL family metal-binding regulatory protein n=1 Tax=Shewanella intestini TaxID=2017544 RepID=A0ABS5I5Z5_9GAMM|nr:MULTISPECIES: hypothetical protein [Shewanella]MBR9728750.1 hypothetical protein [Shewanella intestini]MRG36825.1 hypothetical protein [Shewanella sp. XMDDZSB0408]